MQNRLALKIIIIAVILMQGCSTVEKKGKSSSDTKVDSLLALMTRDEKIGQLALYTSDWAVTGPSMSDNYKDLIRQGKVGAIFNAYTVDYVESLQRIAVNETRLGIPLIFGYDVIHGHRTIFPIPLAQSCSWDLEAIEKSERIAATEATAEGLNWVFAPMVDISRDPRWGRVMEGAGEDTYLGSLIAASRVKGFQGSDPGANNTLLACVKHFAAYGAPEAGREYNTVDISERSLYEWYLPPYKAAIDAGAGSVMTSFNEISGVPASSSKRLLTDLLRNKWGFEGFVVSDYTSINELILHGVATDSAHSAQLAFNAGLDMDMQGNVYQLFMGELIADGRVEEKQLDDAVRRILKAKFDLGLFEDPYRYCNKEREKEEIMTSDNLSFARGFAAKSAVLLKNDNETLPIRNNARTIAVIGPLADSKRDMLGSWSAAGEAEKCVTLLEGVRNRADGKIKIIHSKGTDVENYLQDGINQAVKAAKSADYVILALGESSWMSGEAASKTNISLPAVQMELARKVIAAGVPTAVVLFNGRPLPIEELH